MRLYLYITCILASTIVCAQKQTPHEYIEKFKDLAVIEMHRSGVPASITLAQGVLESNSGNSRLAKYANNHFGIKCKGSWTGNVIYADDDAPDECFRAYESVLESYRDHSDFLRNNWRYQTLFELSTTDYASWCEGLRKAGYATNPNYGSILINLIERYELHKYDLEKMPGTGLPALELVQNVNGVPVHTVKPGESISSIASENYVKDRHIRKWNDLPDDAQIKAGDIVYLKPKRRRGSEEVHKVTEGETMYQISQKYGIKLKQLYRKNRMEYGTEPALGEVLAMQKKRDSDDEVKVKQEIPDWQEEEPKFVNPHSKLISDTSKNKAHPIKIEKVIVPEFHEVVKGDNIYRISERYHILEEDLLRWNTDLNPITMKIGQKIYLNEEAARKANGLRVETPKIATPKEVVKPKTEEEIESIKKEITVDGPVYHHVVKGDTLYNICKRYGVTEDELKKWNKLDTIVVKLGEKLQVSE